MNFEGVTTTGPGLRWVERSAWCCYRSGQRPLEEKSWSAGAAAMLLQQTFRDNMVHRRGPERTRRRLG